MDVPFRELENLFLPFFNLFQERFEKIYRYGKEYSGIVICCSFRKRLQVAQLQGSWIF
jgi:hypothetical protein